MLKEYLQADDSKKKKMDLETRGIPMDSTNNELAYWVNAARNVAPRYSIAIKGDRDADIPSIKRVISILQDNKANRFALITNLDATPEAEPKK